MAKLIMMRGMPASGKSTRAKEIIDGGNYVRVNRDILRTMLHFDKWTGKNESKTVDAEKALVRQFLNNETSVVVDDTNMSDRHHDMWSGIAKECNAKFEVEEIDTDMVTCMQRDMERGMMGGRSVGFDVIAKVALEYDRYPKPEKGVVLCDIDGTIADCEHRRHFVTGETKNWKGFFGAMAGDDPREDVIKQVNDLQEEGYDIILVTARPEDYKEVTKQWVQTSGINHVGALLMRRANDTRPDTEVKEEMFEKYLSRLPIHCVFDDRPSVIRMWESKGLKVIDVGNGEEF